MKKEYLAEVGQKTKEFYSMDEDPRLIVHLIPNVESKEIQEVPRSLSLEKIKKIIGYIVENSKEI